MDTSTLISTLTVSGFLNILINGTIIYCVFTKSPRYMKDYRWFVLNITIADLLYGIHSGLIFQFKLVINDQFAGAIVIGITRHLGDFWGGYFQAQINLSLFFYGMSALTLNFLYRYFCLCSSELIKRYSKRKWLLIIFSTVFVVQVVTSIPSFVMQSRPEDMKTALNLSLVTSVFAYYYVNNLPLYIYAGVGLINNLTLNFINGFCTLFINFTLKKANYSKQTRDMHKSLVTALIIQQSVPLIFFSITALLIVLNLGKIISIDTEMICDIHVCMQTSIGVVNGLATLIFPLTNQEKSGFLAWKSSRQHKKHRNRESEN
ncbi:hypothetical protein FO519_000875 [Halicephalobus sp. NKZ332]|nr:hypothetical protein FO519_000875 [Halicephalobus sp. NKZ332]